ncbi:MAG: MATE family efflux transporter [bacterium]
MKDRTGREGIPRGPGGGARRDLTEGSIGRNIWVLALPMMTSNILETFFEVVDTIYVGRLGASAMAAVSMAGTILFVVSPCSSVWRWPQLPWWPAPSGRRI